MSQDETDRVEISWKTLKSFGIKLGIVIGSIMALCLVLGAGLWTAGGCLDAAGMILTGKTMFWTTAAVLGAICVPLLIVGIIGSIGAEEGWWD